MTAFTTEGLQGPPGRLMGGVIPLQGGGTFPE